VAIPDMPAQNGEPVSALPGEDIAYRRPPVSPRGPAIRITSPPPKEILNQPEMRP
jgi:hypothetical protein